MYTCIDYTPTRFKKGIIKMNLLDAIFGKKQQTIKLTDVKENVIDIRDHIRNSVIPSVKTVAEAASRHSFNDNALYNNIFTLVKSNYKPASKSNQDLFTIMVSVLEESNKVLDEILSLLDKYFQEITDKNSLTYQRYQLVSLINDIDFLSGFCVTLSRYLVLSQVEAKGGEKVKDAMTPAELKEINTKLVEFYRTLSVLSSVNSESLNKLIRDIPSVNITDEGSERRLFNIRRLDPTGVSRGFVANRALNPIFLVLSLISDFKYLSYKFKREECIALTIEIENLEYLISTGHADAVTQRNLDKVRNLLARYQRDVKKYEADILGN